MCVPRNSEKKEKGQVIICVFIKVHSNFCDELRQFYYLKSLAVNAIVIGFFFSMILFIFREFGEVDQQQNIPSPSCPSGFTYDQLRLKCFDINECEENSCKICRSKICENLIGSFKCKNPKCPIGYRIHASYRRTHVNKCVRKRCRRKDENCHQQPKFRSFRTFYISPASDVRKYGGVVIHEIYTRKYRRGIVVEMSTDGLKFECVKRQNLELRLKSFGKLILILKNVAELNQKCSNSVKFVELRFKNRFSEEIIESLRIKLNFVE